MRAQGDRWTDTWWAWAAAAFLVHASLVAILLRIRDFRGFSRWSWAERGPLAHAADGFLHATDFWVYAWIIRRLNNERFGLPFIRAAEIVGVRQLDTLLFAWEFVILAVFGGGLYAVIVVAVWVRRRRARALPAAA